MPIAPQCSLVCILEGFHHSKGDGARTGKTGVFSYCTYLGATVLGPLRIPVMLRTLLFFLHERLENGGSLQDPPPQNVSVSYDLTFFADAKAIETDAWIYRGVCSRQGQQYPGVDVREAGQRLGSMVVCQKGLKTYHCSVGALSNIDCNSFVGSLWW